MPLVTDIINLLTQAATDAASNATTAQTKAGQSTTVATTPPQCLEGFTKLNEARQSQGVAHDKAGNAQGLYDALNALNLLAIVGNIPTAQQMADALAKRDSAVKAAKDADVAITAAEPTVIAGHDSCILSTMITPLQNCVTAGIAAANNATRNIQNPLGGPVGNLDVIVREMIRIAATDSNFEPKRAENSCNAGIQVLADAANLIAAKTTAAQLQNLEGCINQLGAALPTDPLVAAGTTAKNAAQTIIDNARNLITSTSDPNILKTWRKRIVCTMNTATIHVHVMDESGDDYGDDDATGASINILSFPFSSLLPELNVPVGVADEHGKVQIAGVPLAPLPLPIPTGTPPAPPSLPTPDFALLQFTASHSSRNNGVASAGVDHNGIINGGVSVEIRVPDTSPTS